MQYLHLFSAGVIYIYALHYILSKASAAYSAFRLYIYYQYVCSLGVEPTIFCAANTMLYHLSHRNTIEGNVVHVLIC